MYYTINIQKVQVNPYRFKLGTIIGGIIHLYELFSLIFIQRRFISMLKEKIKIGNYYQH